MTCRGCDKEISASDPTSYFGDGGPYCRACASEVRAMHGSANRPKEHGIKGWLKRFFIGG